MLHNIFLAASATLTKKKNMSLAHARRFTTIALAISVYGLAFDADAWAVGACLLWGSATSFSCAPFFDGTVYTRMRKANGWSRALFHAGNGVLHLLPLVVTCTHPPRASWHHGVVAAFVHFFWGLLISGGTLRLDDVYVPLPPAAWHILWGITLATEVIVACVV